MNASDIMTKKVLTVDPQLEIHKLADFFVKNNISGAPVDSFKAGIIPSYFCIN